MTDEARRVRIDVAYDGTDFAGWQLQREQRTVQGELERVLTDLQGGERVKLRGAGRTDSGVHARGQVADCRIATRLDDATIERALSRMLPSDVRPLAVATCAEEFHSQMSARSKRYRYRIDRSPHGDPFQARYALHHRHRLDPGLIEQALRSLPGRRDWSGFAASACEKVDRIRTLTGARLVRSEACWELHFAADGFLQYMVRNIVGTLLEIGGERMPVGIIEEILATGDRNLGGPTAAAHGLCLMGVRYSEDGP